MLGMADSPPRDPKSADGAPPNAGDAPQPTGEQGGARAPMSSNLQYMLKQPSTPWVTFDRDSKVAKDEGGGPLPDPLDAGWGEATEDVLPLRSAPPPPVARAAEGPAPVAPVPPADVPPPPPHLMAMVDQVLSQSRPPPADPGPAHEPRPGPVFTAMPSDVAPPVATAPVVAPRAALQAEPAPPANVAPLNDAPRPADLAQPAPFAAPAMHDDADAELAPIPTRSPLLFVAIGGALILVLGLAAVGFFVLRSPASATTAPIPAVSVTPMPSASPVASVSPPPDIVTGPATSASVAHADTAPSSTPAAPSASSASPPPVSPLDPKTGLPRASFLTIPRALARHYIFLDGKRMLGTGARSFPVKCGEHTLAIDDRKAERVINVECGGEYIVTN